MATNSKFTNVSTLSLAVASGFASGDPYTDNGIKGYLETTRDANGNATLRLSQVAQVATFTVGAGTDDSSIPAAGSAVARGDTLYQNATTKAISKDSSGTVLFGYALGTLDANGAYPDGTVIASGQSAAIDVLLA